MPTNNLLYAVSMACLPLYEVHLNATEAFLLVTEFDKVLFAPPAYYGNTKLS
jgi:hypothetical protein